MDKILVAVNALEKSKVTKANIEVDLDILEVAEEDAFDCGRIEVPLKQEREGTTTAIRHYDGSFWSQIHNFADQGLQQMGIPAVYRVKYQMGETIDAGSEAILAGELNRAQQIAARVQNHFIKVNGAAFYRTTAPAWEVRVASDRINVQPGFIDPVNCSNSAFFEHDCFDDAMEFAHAISGKTGNRVIARGRMHEYREMVAGFSGINLAATRFRNAVDKAIPILLLHNEDADLVKAAQTHKQSVARLSTKRIDDAEEFCAFADTLATRVDVAKFLSAVQVVRWQGAFFNLELAPSPVL